MAALIDTPPTMGTLEAGMISSGASMGGGIMLWLGQNATALGILITFTSLVLTATFFILNLMVTRRGQNINRREIEHEIIHDILEKATSDERVILDRILRAHDD